MNAAPILLHNVTIKGSSHCGSARHLAPAFGTPGEGARAEGEEIARCIISPSVITLCLYRGHGNSISAQPGSKMGRMPVVPLTASPKINSPTLFTRHPILFLPVFSCITYLLLWFVRLIMRSCQGDTRRITTTLRRRDEQHCWAKILKVILRRPYFNDDTVSDNKDILEWERHSSIKFIC